MGYIEKNLVPGERILHKTRKHMIIFFFPAIFTIFAWFASEYMHANPLLKQVNWVPGLLVLIFWAYAWLEYRFSEFAVTNKRVMMREGFFNRHANEIRLSAIAQVSIDQGLVGQMLHFGIVTINAFGAYDSYTMIDQPGAFQKAVNSQLDQVLGNR